MAWEGRGRNESKGGEGNKGERKEGNGKLAKWKERGRRGKGEGNLMHCSYANLRALWHTVL